MLNPLRRNARWLATGLLLKVFIAHESGAQPSYRFSTDTLRYLERTIVNSTTDLGRVVVRLPFEAQASVAIVLGPVSRGWFEQLRLTVEVPGHVETVPTDELIGKPFSFRFSPRGRTDLQTAPTAPKEVAETTDLSQEFGDIFVSLPLVPLARGITWTDTVRSDLAGRPEDINRTERIRTFRVQSDTSYGSFRAWVVRFTTRITYEYLAERAQPLGRIAAQLSGEEEGWALLALDGSHLYFRAREGTLRGTVRLVGRSGNATIPQEYSYQSALHLKSLR